MLSRFKLNAAFILLQAALSAATVHAADQQAGRLVQLRGSATIERGNAQLPAQLKAGILASDVITTANASRAKLLFIDDSVLTMAENSKLVVKEFIYSKGKEGKSVFNLLDGKMRSVVGKTKFEVHTPTAVAAARGTVIYFDVGVRNNQSYSRIICLEGNVQIRNIINTVSGQVTLTPGTMVVVKANEPPPPPVPAPPAELDRARKATQSSGDPSGGGDGSSGGGSTTGDNQPKPDQLDIKPVDIIKPPIEPPINLQPIVQPRKVNITIGIPGQ